MNPILPAASPEDLLARAGTLAIVRPEANGRPKLFVVLLDDGAAVGFNGHVDLGTGIRTALSQIIAEELDLPMAQVAMVLGDTLWTPDQGSTTASETIQFTAVPLRHAAAQARRWLVARAAERMGLDPDELYVTDGQVMARGGSNQGLSYAELIAGETNVLQLDETTPVKDHSRYSIVGRSAPRVDIPDKATGLHTYVHDVRLPGMLHGRVIRPPYAGRDGGAFIGRSLASVDESSVAGMPGVLQVVVIHDFVGVVAEREEQAEAAAKALKVQWNSFEDLPGLNPPENAIRANPSKPRVLRDDGDIDEKLAGAATRLTRTYVWPYQMHGSIGPCCSVAAFDEAGRLTVWSGTQTQQMLKSDLALLLDMPVEVVEVIRLETAGSYGRSGMDDVGADAALLARAVGRPVRVQLSRDQEHAWEPKGAGQLMDVDGGLDAGGDLYVYDFASRYPSNMSPMLALLLTRKVEPIPTTQAGGDRTAIPAYRYPSIRAVTHDMPAIVRAAFFRGVSALPNVFAHESFIDELAELAGVDPVEYRLRYLRDDRVCDLVRAVAERAGWTPHVGPQREQVAPDIVRGRGFAYATYVHGPFPGKPAAAAAWVADVEVNTATGEVAVTRVTVGQDSGMMINPDGVRHQIEGNVVQSTSRTLMEEVIYDKKAVVSRDWSTYPILKFTEVPAIDVALMLRPDDPPMGVGESASVPSAAAIANAVYDATGVRFRELPLTPEKVRAGLLAFAGAQPKPRAKPASKVRTALLAGVAAGAAAAVALFSPAKPIAPVAPQGAHVYSAETLERGQLVAAAGNCDGCHTAAEGARLAGGVALHTPFGIVYGTNITPDVETGIGAWSYPAFERAMRQGISRDGHHLYPAFPYTAFARLTDADTQALYGYLMAQPAVRAVPPRTELAFPMSVRPLMAGWNALYNKAEPFAPDTTRSAQWNRGAYLVEGAGHCSACHSPRNALGAEMGGERHLSGGVVDGWDAPPLGARSPSPVPWTEDALYSYLRTGASDQHGATAGPMLAVVAELSVLPDGDIRAMAHYLAARAPAHVSEKDAAARAQALSQLGRASLGAPDSVGARVFDGACAVCHANATPDLFGGKVSLPLSSAVHAARPDNLIRTVMAGVSDPSKGARGAMPAFGGQLNDAQLADLVAYIRRTQAVGKPAWDDVPQTIARIRRQTTAPAHRSAPGDFHQPFTDELGPRQIARPL
jgi:nicotinate dehydrogenase subunit B